MSAWYLQHSTSHYLIAPLSLAQHTAEYALLSNCIVMSFAVLGHVHLHFFYNNGSIPYQRVQPLQGATCNAFPQGILASTLTHLN